MNRPRRDIRVLYAFPEPLPLPHARGVQVAHTLGSLLDQGCEVTLAYTPAPQDAEPLSAYGLHPSTSLRTLQLTRRPEGFLKILPFRSNHFFNRQLIAWLKRKNNQTHSPDVILTRHLKTAYALLKAKLNVMVVYEAHEVFARSAKERSKSAHAQMELFVLSHATRVIAISNALVEGLIEEHGIQREYDVLHSSTDIPENIPDKPWQECAKHVIYTGSLHAWKGVDDLIKAVRWLPKHRITVIGGTADQIDRLRSLLPETGGQVNLLPHRPHTEIKRLLAEACIAVLPNRTGSISAWTSPLKLFEYMGAGCAIVASDLPSIREILTSDEVALVPPENPVALADAIRTLTEAPNRAAAMGQHLRSRAQEFSWDRHGIRLASILETAITNHTGNR